MTALLNELPPRSANPLRGWTYDLLAGPSSVSISGSSGALNRKSGRD